MMDGQQRLDLAPLIRERRESRFGTKRAAYTDAGINPTTWDRAEAGETVRGDLMRRIVRTLWPETDGDYRRIEQGRGNDPITPELDEAIRLRVEHYLREHDGAHPEG